MQIEDLSEKGIHLGTVVEGTDPGGSIDTAINAMITQRLVAFYKNLVDNGLINPLPHDGPPAF